MGLWKYVFFFFYLKILFDCIAFLKLFSQQKVVFLICLHLAEIRIFKHLESVLESASPNSIMSYCSDKLIFIQLLCQTKAFMQFERLKRLHERSSMLKACIFPKSLTTWGGIFKSMNCQLFLCIWSNRYVNHVKTNFWWLKYHQMGR